MDNTEDSHPQPAAGVLEHDVHAALAEAMTDARFRAPIAFTRALVPVVVRVIGAAVEKATAEGDANEYRLTRRAEKAEAEGDALAAAIKRVRVAVADHDTCRHAPCAVCAALDGTETTR